MGPTDRRRYVDGKLRFEDFSILMKLSRPAYYSHRKTEIIFKVLFFSNTYCIKEKVPCRYNSKFAE